VSQFRGVKGATFFEQLRKHRVELVGVTGEG
jgi:hypothetical protein